MKYSLERVRDGEGDSGSISMAIFEDENGKIQFEMNSRPRVGVQMQVGSPFARTRQYQDYWQTTDVLEILKETENSVEFKTSNSIYIWKELIK